MKNFVICYNKTISDSIKVKEKLSLILQKNDNCVFETDINNLKYINNTEFVFVIGGDGTILKAARFFAAYKIPVFGINLGRLGFLSQSSKEELENAVNKILENKFITEQRIMLKDDAAVSTCAVTDISVNQVLSFRRLPQAGQYAQRRAFPAAGRTDDADKFPRFH